MERKLQLEEPRRDVVRLQRLRDRRARREERGGHAGAGGSHKRTSRAGQLPELCAVTHVRDDGGVEEKLRPVPHGAGGKSARRQLAEIAADHPRRRRPACLRGNVVQP